MCDGELHQAFDSTQRVPLIGSERLPLCSTRGAHVLIDNCRTHAFVLSVIVSEEAPNREPVN